MAKFATRLEASKRKHTTSPSGAQDEPAMKQQKRTEGEPSSTAANTSSNQEETTPATKPSRPDLYPFKSIKSPKKRPWCAIRVGTGEDAVVIGDPFGKNDDLQISLAIDAGDKGTPSIGINFTISNQLSEKAAGKRKDTGIETPDKKEDHSFTVGWEPGLKIDHEFMIEDFQCRAVGGLKGKAFPGELREHTDSDRKKENLYLMRFRSLSTKSSDIPPETLHGCIIRSHPHPDLVRQLLRQIFHA